MISADMVVSPELRARNKATAASTIPRANRALVSVRPRGSRGSFEGRPKVRVDDWGKAWLVGMLRSRTGPWMQPNQTLGRGWCRSRRRPSPGNELEMKRRAGRCVGGADGRSCVTDSPHGVRLDG